MADFVVLAETLFPVLLGSIKTYVILHRNGCWEACCFSESKAAKVIYPGADPGFWSGRPSGVLTPRVGLNPKFAQNRGFFLKICRKTGEICPLWIRYWIHDHLARIISTHFLPQKVHLWLISLFRQKHCFQFCEDSP